MSPGTKKSSSIEPTRLFLLNIVRKIFFEDWLLKLLALVITLGLWLGVTGLSTKSTRRLTVNLVPDLANNAIITNDPDSKIDIVVSGAEREIKALSPKDLTAAMDLSNVQPGERIISLSPDNVSVSGLPDGVRLEEVPTRRIAVRLETVDEIDLPVIADTEGNPASGFEVYSDAVVTPQRVRLRGPAGVLRSMQSVSTEPVFLNGRSSDFAERQVHVKLPSEILMSSDTVVDVSVRIGEIRIKKTLSVLISGSTGKKAAVEFYGPRSVLDKMRPDMLKVELTKPDGGPETPQLILPADLQNIVEVRKIKMPS